ncbi:MAG TPA: hypothetical protein DER60_09235, partial [Syntrophomonas sp.]|nr:hypothetical protein [Syntrophomonas sp.]
KTITVSWLFDVSAAMASKGKNIIKLANTHDMANTGEEMFRHFGFVIIFINTDLLFNQMISWYMFIKHRCALRNIVFFP